MPRTPRYSIPGVPLHVIQRGNNRLPCFFHPSDHTFYVRTLFEMARKCDVSIHAYVMMTNHVHILATPTDDFGVSRMMQRLGAKYVSYINRVYQRTGTLWEGRFRSSLVSSEEYCLACYRYIELNPVRAGMVRHPGEYPWSSYRANTGLGSNFPPSHHPQWLALGKTDYERFSKYRTLVAQVLPERQLDQIRLNVCKGLPTGSDQFKAEMESALAVKLSDGRRGRPPKAKKGL